MTDKPLPSEEVFLSYCKKDWERVKPIVEALQAKKWDVSIDRDMLSAQDWARWIERGLERCYAVIVVWSQHSKESEWQPKEIEAGIKKDRLFPITIDNATAPPAFGHRNAVNLSDWNGDPNDVEFAKVAAAVENQWTIDSGMALRHDITALKPMKVIKRSPYEP